VSPDPAAPIRTPTSRVGVDLRDGLTVYEELSLFRDGPSGRRAGLAGGPDVWEVIAAIRTSGLEGDAALVAAAEWGSLTAMQVRAAARYYGEYREEIDERIRRHVEEADAAEEQWRRERDALA
jgi:hypothetical protein